MSEVVAEAQIIEAMRRVHFAIARVGYCPLGQYQDMQSAGYVAIAKALPRWRSDGGSSFLSYCDLCVVAALRGFLRHNGKRVVEPLPHPVCYSDGPGLVISAELRGHIAELREPYRGVIVNWLADDDERSSTIYMRRARAVAMLRARMGVN